jgi:8-oxo-dGTP diphosphatase
MREDFSNKIEVHVAGICFNYDKVLVAKRAENRSFFPGLWECGGGQVNSGENFEEAVLRQIKEELNVTAKIISVFKTYEILTNDEQKKIPGLIFICKFLQGEPKISEEHSELRWQSVDKLNELEFIPTLEDNIKEAYSRYTEYI